MVCCVSALAPSFKPVGTRLGLHDVDPFMCPYRILSSWRSPVLECIADVIT